MRIHILVLVRIGISARGWDRDKGYIWVEIRGTINGRTRIGVRVRVIWVRVRFRVRVKDRIRVSFRGSP